MKRLFSLLLVSLVISMVLVTPLQAAYPGDNRTNVLKPDEVIIDTANKSPLITTFKDPAAIIDGIIQYTGDAGTYFDCKFAANASDALNPLVKYDIDGVENPEGKYLCWFTIELNSVRNIDGFTYYAQTNLGNIDGFDLLFSETGDPGSWSVAYSGTDLMGQKKYIYGTAEELTCYTTSDFPAKKAKFIRFALTSPRSQNIEALAELAMIPNANPQYFRIAEIELYEAAGSVNAPVDTTAATAVTTAPAITTAKPDNAAQTTAKNVTTSPSTSDNTTVVFAAAVLMSAFTVVKLTMSKKKSGV